MLGAMLVGAWLLIQQQCCSVYGDSGSRFRNAAIVDPLMRRSPLEKNFMRFGRSSPSTFSRDVRLKENFIRFGRTALDLPADKNLVPFFRPSEKNAGSGDVKLDRGGFARLRRAKDNFMRFGRGDRAEESYKVNEEKTKRQSNLMRFGRSLDYSDLADLTVFRIPDFPRDVRVKENLMRFGRDKERVVRNEKNKQDSFIRFGKSENPDEMEFDNCDKTTVASQIRAGDNVFNRFRIASNKFEKLNTKAIFDSTNKPVLTRVLRDQNDIQRNPRQRTQDTGFIRFGRSKRDAHKNRKPFHHSNSDKHNSRHDPKPGSCKYSLLSSNTIPAPGNQCIDSSCKSLNLPWPFYYQPSFYSVLPNILGTPQGSLLPTPMPHKPKRSRGNLQNFIRLG